MTKSERSSKSEVRTYGTKFLDVCRKGRYFGASVVGFFIIRNGCVSPLCMGSQTLLHPAQAQIFKTILAAAPAAAGLLAPYFAHLTFRGAARAAIGARA